MEKLYRTALALSIVTILYNLVEGSISTFFGVLMRISPLVWVIVRIA